MNDLLTSLLDPLEILLLVTAFLVTSSSSVRQIIRHYRAQSYLLAFVTALTAAVKGGSGVAILIIGIFVLPFVLALIIEALLARATVELPSLRLRLTLEEMQQARRIWRENEGQSNAQGRDVLAFIVLVTLAVVIAFGIQAPFNPSDRIGLMVSLALHLVGLYNMVVKRDIITQVVGLLIMDHGLYLAVVKIVAIPVPATFFVFALYLYTLITIVILTFMLPQIRRKTGSINLDTIAAQSTLEG